MKLTALCGSIRSTNLAKDFVIQAVNDSQDLEAYLQIIHERCQPNPPNDKGLLSNSEILSGVALMGARNQGCAVDFFPLLDLFKRREHKLEDFNPEDYELEPEIVYRDLLQIEEKALEELKAKVSSSEGIILISPVYFGDRSSVMNKFMQIAAKENLLKDKVVGVCSVGAKRNGGQETTNIFLLYEALHLGAYAVGNGPESSQYGGTAWAGDKGKVITDHFGIETTFGAGERVAQVCHILSHAPGETRQTSIALGVLITMDTPERKLLGLLEKYFAEASVNSTQVTFRIIQLVEGDIERCLACNICPIPHYLPEGYACIIRRTSDSLSQLRDELLNVDGIILAGLNLNETSKVICRYQAFVERTRFIRRNDFELTNIPITSFLVSEIGASMNPIYNLKVMTSFIRHNGIIIKPVTVTLFQEQVLAAGLEDFNDFVRRTRILKVAREATTAIAVRYKALGYHDKSLDETIALRK